MIKFRMYREEPYRFSTFFPEALTKERARWGSTTTGVEGQLTRYRLIKGPAEAWVAIRKRINQIAREFSSIRSHNPEIDRIHLLEELQQMQATGLEYWDYAGRVDTVSREQIFAQYGVTSRIGLDRDVGVGFRGIVVKSDAPFSVEGYALEELTRTRMALLNGGWRLKNIGVSEPPRLREAAEDQMRDMLRVAWTEYATAPTKEKMRTVVQIEQLMDDYIVQTLDYVQKMGTWEGMIRMPFPDKGTAVALWEQDKIDRLTWDETEPWWPISLPESSIFVTAMRGATLLTDKLRIQLTMYPIVSSLEHPQYSDSHQMITYRRPSSGFARVNPNVRERSRVPFVDAKGGTDDLWEGPTQRVPGWKVIKGEGSIPDPQLRVNTRLIRIPDGMAGRLLAATEDRRPTVTIEHLNGASGPLLVLPRALYDVVVYPLFSGGRMITPINPESSVSGWAVDRDDRGRQFFGSVPSGFLVTAAEARPARKGSLTEIMNY